MSETQPTLVILAAGLGRRFGGLKQLTPVGPAGATIMDYSIFDAWRAGFARIVFVIRPELEDALRRWCEPRFAERIRVTYAFQRADALPRGVRSPAGRCKPWGTGHAVLAAADVVSEPFGVVNADDFYGAGAFRLLAEFLRAVPGDTASAPTYALVGYALRDTLPPEGRVNRALCRCTATGWLEDIVEVAGLERHGADVRRVDARGLAHDVAGDQRVSMNMWGFTPAVFAQLEAEFRRFLEASAAPTEDEFHLPTGIRSLIRSGRARVRVLVSPGAWCGVTHARDTAQVAERIGQFVARGVYPQELWA